MLSVESKIVYQLMVTLLSLYWHQLCDFRTLGLICLCSLTVNSIYLQTRFPQNQLCASEFNQCVS